MMKMETSIMNTKQEIDEAIRRSLLLKLQKQPKLPEYNNETT